jgi:hypothetical protein
MCKHILNAQVFEHIFFNIYKISLFITCTQR